MKKVQRSVVAASSVSSAEIVRIRLVSSVQEAEAAITNMSYSSQITEGQDFSAAIFDATQNLLAANKRGSASFVATLGRGVRGVLKLIPPDALRPGDTLMTNDPWLGGGHVPDVLTIRPVFWRHEIVAYAASIVHVADLGGRPTADARDTFEEGLHLPPCYLYREGKLNSDIMAIVGANARRPRQVLGDLQAMGAANALMERRILETLDDGRCEDLNETSRELQGRAERAMCSRVADLPDGVYRQEVYSDGGGESVKVALALNVVGDQIYVDFAGTSEQSRWGLNVPSQLTYAEAVYALTVSLGSDLPPLEGVMRPFHVSAPVGCILNPLPPAPTMVRSAVAHNVCAAVWGALAPLVPEYIDASNICAHFGGLWSIRFRGVYRATPKAYKKGGPSHMIGPFTETYFATGGMGALGDRDGRNTVSMPVNCSNVPIEIMEARAPVMFEEKRLLMDSGGAGQYRGGLGQQVRVRVLSDDPLDFIMGTTDRINHPPFGLSGGGSGGGGFLAIEDVPVDRRTAHRISHGEVVTECIPGGGGYGPASQRSREAVERDLRLGFVSEAAAERDYATVLHREPRYIER